MQIDHSFKHMNLGRLITFLFSDLLKFFGSANVGSTHLVSAFKCSDEWWNSWNNVKVVHEVVHILGQILGHAAMETQTLGPATEKRNTILKILLFW